MSSIRKLYKCALFAVLIQVSTGAGATAFTTNFTDIWLTPGEPGSGVEITMESSTMFAALFGYGQDTKPLWLSATLEFAGLSATGEILFTGDLYETTGPWFGGTFNPALVQYRKVGTAAFKASTLDTATLQYSVDGVNVAKVIKRFTLRSDTLSGSYLGGLSSKAFNCTNPANNNLIFEDGGFVSVTHTGSLVTIRTPSCILSGTYTQTGQIGGIQGTFSCSNGESGTITALEIRTESTGMIGRYLATSQFCNYDANFGGIKRK